MRLESVVGHSGRAVVDGVGRELRLDLVEAQVGDWVLVHAGYAIQVLDEAAAAETLALLRELDPPAAAPPPAR
jgi:hydrogenase expression/formation protein HypC